MNGRERTLCAAGAAAVALTAWGLWGMGRAADVFPEKVERTDVVTEDTDVLPAETAVWKRGRLYDSAQYLRGEALKDPFRKEGEISMPAVGDRILSSPSVPILQGIFIVGNDRRALFLWKGGAETIREGERLGSWTVEAIEPNEVYIGGMGGTLALNIDS